MPVGAASIAKRQKSAELAKSRPFVVLRIVRTPLEARAGARRGRNVPASSVRSGRRTHNGRFSESRRYVEESRRRTHTSSARSAWPSRHQRSESAVSARRTSPAGRWRRWGDGTRSAPDPTSAPRRSCRGAPAAHEKSWCNTSAYSPVPSWREPKRGSFTEPPAMGRGRIRALHACAVVWPDFVPSRTARQVSSTRRCGGCAQRGPSGAGPGPCACPCSTFGAGAPQCGQLSSSMANGPLQYAQNSRPAMLCGSIRRSSG